MPQSLAKILVHVVFSTKDRQPFLKDKILRDEMHCYLGGILDNLKCRPVIVGGASTGRRGHNWLRIVDREKVEFRFTFTERELWVKKPFTPCILASQHDENGASPNSGQVIPSSESDANDNLPPAI